MGQESFLMEHLISQEQNQRLLEEHFQSSLEFAWVAKYELYIGLAFLGLGLLLEKYYPGVWLLSIPLIIIGGFEVLKFPGRQTRWVKKKQRERLFEETLQFDLEESGLSVAYADRQKTIPFQEMWACHISGLGIHFKVSRLEYYYLSFNSIEDPIQRAAFIRLIQENFPTDRLRVRQS